MSLMTRILWALSENIEIMTLIAMVLRLRIGVEKISSNGDRELTRLAPTPPCRGDSCEESRRLSGLHLTRSNQTRQRQGPRRKGSSTADLTLTLDGQE
jgi:hypothetical protein